MTNTEVTTKQVGGDASTESGLMSTTGTRYHRNHKEKATYDLANELTLQ